MLTKNFKQLQTEVADHVKADSVSQGSYTTCFIGCLANGVDDPRFIQETYGIPRLLIRLSESIFEGLTHDEAVDFFVEFPKAVACNGKDLTLVVWQFLASELRSLPPVSDEVQALIDSVIEGLGLLSRGETWPGDKAAIASADRAADIATPHSVSKMAARAVHYSASAAAYPFAAAFAVVSTASQVAVAATEATCSAEDYDSSAVTVVRRRQRDTLLRLIKEAPINTMEIK